jgi:hypothetical protein
VTVMVDQLFYVAASTKVRRMYSVHYAGNDY